MAKSKRQGSKSKNVSSGKSIPSKTRYIIYAVVAIAAIASVLLLTRDKNAIQTDSSSSAQDAAPTVPLRMDFLKEGILSFYDTKGEYLRTIDIELAESNDERQLGLMYREQMGENQGMFFIFPYDMMQSFWMKNTVLPLDIIYINSQQEIVTIQKNTTPFVTSSYESTAPAQYVLEVNAGFVDRNGITEGWKIGWMRTN